MGSSIPLSLKCTSPNLGCIWSSRCFSARFQLELFDSSLTFPQLIRRACSHQPPMTYQIDRTLTPVARERGVVIRGLGSRIGRDSSNRRAERALRLAVRERGLAGTTVAPPGRARARVGSREKMGRSGRTRRGRVVALFPVTLPPPEPRHTAPDQPPLRSSSGQSQSSPRGDTLGTRRASSATAAESQGPPPESATQSR